MRAYCDSSILVKRAVSEPDSDEACALLDDLVRRGGVFVTSTLARVEVGRAILRHAPDIEEAELQALISDAIDDTVQAELTHAYLHVATSLRSPHLRSLDAIHLATAILTECDVVITRDRQMTRACEELGLAVA